MTLTRALAVTFGLGLLLIAGCDTRNALHDEKPLEEELTVTEFIPNNRLVVLYKQENLTLRYEAIMSDSASSVESRVSLEDMTQAISRLVIPVNDEGVEEEMADYINSAADWTYQRFESQRLQETVELNALAKAYEDLMDALYLSEGGVGQSQLAYSIIYHYAAINTALRTSENRSLGKTASGACTPYIGFLRGFKPFVCLEDIVVSLGALEDRITSTGRTLEEYGLSNFVAHLRDNGRERFTAKELEDFTSGKAAGKTAQPMTCPGGAQGCTAGCCGNYSGDCIYCDYVCLAHDIWCWECNHGFLCGSGCQSGGCE